MVIALIIAAACVGLAVLGEWLHGRRVRRVARLAFGPTGRPSAWARSAPAVRVAGVGLAAWGAVVLALYDPTGSDQEPSEKASRHLLIALDVSPSMLLEDAGPDIEKVSRSAWAGKVVQGILDRLDMKETRITVVVFYTRAIVALQETTDKNVISNMFDGLRLHVAFEGGATNLASGVREAVKVARPWPRRSATLVVVSDGDSKGILGDMNLPPSISDSIVIGVGDPHKATVISGHSSKQESASLKQLAAKLRGTYHDGNQRHLPSEVLRKLSMITPDSGVGIGLREAALIAVGTGSGALALLNPMLMAFGLRRTYVKERRSGAAARAAAGGGAVTA